MPHFKKLSKLISQNLSKNHGNYVYLLRHGQSMGNHAGTIVGWTDSRLSIKGRQQAHKMYNSLYLHTNRFSSIHSSDLSRCKDTLQLALGHPNKNIVQSKQLRQLNFGDEQGVHFDSLPQQKKKIVNSLKYEAPNGQNWIQVRKRSLNYLLGLGNGHHLVCTHGGLICSLTYDYGIKHVVKNCSLIGIKLGKNDIEEINITWQFPSQE